MAEKQPALAVGRILLLPVAAKGLLFHPTCPKPAADQASFQRAGRPKKVIPLAEKMYAVLFLPKAPLFDLCNGNTIAHSFHQPFPGRYLKPRLASISQ